MVKKKMRGFPKNFRKRLLSKVLYMSRKTSIRQYGDQKAACPGLQSVENL